jgi:quinoprotein glucose dehydrogenase
MNTSNKFGAFVLLPVLAAIALTWTTSQAIAQSGSTSREVRNSVGGWHEKDSEWAWYTADMKGTRYRPLDQINASNFNKLQLAWRFKTESLGAGAEYRLEATPLVVNGVLYASGGQKRAVFALNPTTGQLLWEHKEDEGDRGEFAPRLGAGRGVSYWTDGTEERIVYVTPGYRMIALDAKTGTPVPTFGKNGVVDLKQDDDQNLDLLMADVGLNATPLIVKDTIVVGAAGREGATPVIRNNVKCFVRGFDARTGKRLWIFHTIPRKGERGYDTWESGSADVNGNTGVWTQMTADEDLGLVYLPVETPTNDYYGGHRLGNNLFAESLVCLDVKTGDIKWYYQVVHHPLWDFDLSSAPILADIRVGERTVKAVALPSKQAFLYVFDRVTGKPVWPIEERPVPQSNVPGEKTSPTQPFPTKPPAYARQGLSNEDLIDFTPELHQEAMEIASKFRLGPVFTPPVVSSPNGPYKMLALSTSLGGTNWPGGSYDPETHTVYVSANQQVLGLSLMKVNDKRFSDSDYVYGDVINGLRDVQGASGDGPRLHDGQTPTQLYAPPPTETKREGMGGGFLGAPTVEGLPINKPPYGTISAVNLDRGEITWQVAHGETPDPIRNSPLLKGLNIPRTGQSTSVGILVTKSLVVAGEPAITTTAQHPRGAMLRAYDKPTGREVGAIFMEAPQTGSPMTYELNGKQYLVLVIGGGNITSELVAYALPNQGS